MKIDMKITGAPRARRSVGPLAIAAMRRSIRAALNREGEIVREMLTGHLTGKKLLGKRPARLMRSTLATRAARGNPSAAPLLDYRELLDSIGVYRKGDTVFVGIKRGARNRRGFPLTVLGQQLELGTTIVQRITPAMIGKLREMGVPPSGQGDGSGVVVIRIKPRPWLAPLRDAYDRDKRAPERVANAVQVGMRGVW